jgi:hypothetical protein
VEVDLGNRNRQKAQEKAPWVAKTRITNMVLRLAEGVRRLLRPCSPLGQVKAAAVHVLDKMAVAAFCQVLAMHNELKRVTAKFAYFRRS